MKKAVLLILIILCSGCMGQVDKRDASSYEDAVVIRDIGDYEKSVQQEYEYIRKRCGTEGVDWNLSSHRLSNKNEKKYDILVIILLPSKEEIAFYFDITEPFSEYLKRAYGEEDLSL